MDGKRAVGFWADRRWEPTAFRFGCRYFKEALRYHYYRRCIWWGDCLPPCSTLWRAVVRRYPFVIWAKHFRGIQPTSRRYVRQRREPLWNDSGGRVLRVGDRGGLQALTQ